MPTPRTLRIFSAQKSTILYDRHNHSQFPPKNCRFEDSDAKDAPEPLRTQLNGYDGLLYIFCADSNGKVSEQTFYRWKRQFTGLEIEQVRQLTQLPDENGWLKIDGRTDAAKATFIECSRW